MLFIDPLQPRDYTQARSQGRFLGVTCNPPFKLVIFMMTNDTHRSRAQKALLYNSFLFCSYTCVYNIVYSLVDGQVVYIMQF